MAITKLFNIPACNCDYCNKCSGKFEKSWERNPLIKCPLCGEIRDKVQFLPEVVKDFFSVTEICWCCRNCINHAVMKDFQLCWEISLDETIKLALTWFSMGKLELEIYRKTNYSWRKRKEKTDG